MCVRAGAGRMGRRVGDRAGGRAGGQTSGQTSRQPGRRAIGFWQAGKYMYILAYMTGYFGINVCYSYSFEWIPKKLSIFALCTHVLVLGIVMNTKCFMFALHVYIYVHSATSTK